MLENNLRRYLPGITLRIMSDHTSLDLAVAEEGVLDALGYGQLYEIGMKYENELHDYVHNHALMPDDVMETVQDMVAIGYRMNVAMAEVVIEDIWFWAHEDYRD